MILFGRIPSQVDVDEDISDIVFNGYLFSILEIDEKVISRVRVMKIEKEDPIE